ncbi:alpha/beta hydrolase-fold protein [Corynebacterium propinquum]|uniref:alpha/beta hydrolase-fold protein n=1 Tax=Corynebacterium propinquum TaxID=43769 RepID=UPI002540CBB5|nr:alpha/beta hydrolase-fold protein [Corynebacterium propinquum]MDK4235490.1 alpha/beta hydrolase-fold protein [Corynebacterium propinquum]MDK4282348.1 alpha/beta hydrolase-fold protein [Corynebacterium propinquum]MDK4302181.1 alpha/beta hydrolase-fold protein [Corynebacterium propinquum]
MNVLPGEEAELRRQLEQAVAADSAGFADSVSGIGTTQLDSAWNRVAAGGFPRRSQDGSSYVFAVRHSELQAVTSQRLPPANQLRATGLHLHINRLTDKLKYDLGAMTHIPGTDIWTHSVAVSSEYQGSYGFQLTEGHRTATMCDPHAIRTLWCEDGFGLSEISQPLPVGKQEMRVIPGQLDDVRFLLYLPAADMHGAAADAADAGGADDELAQKVGLVTLFDGENWQKANLAAHIAAVNENSQRQWAVLSIVNDSNAQRVRRLGLDEEFLGFVCTQLTAYVVTLAAEHCVELSPEHRILAGQSLGGLAALRIAQLYPDAYDTVLAQSPSLWWRPERKAVPTDNNLQNYSWITEEFLSQQVMPRIHIDVGVREDVGVAKAFLLARKLESCNWPHNLTVYEGGHDFVSWRAQLLKHVRTLTV